MLQKASAEAWHVAVRWAPCDTAWRGNTRKTQVPISIDWTNKMWTLTGRKALG